jgi:putative flippase GtrA
MMFSKPSVRAVPARFAAVGLVCAAGHNIIVIALACYKVHYGLACLISFALIVPLGYALHVRFTFEQTSQAASFWRYAAGMAANYPLTLGLLFVMCDIAGWPVAIAAPVATVALMAWNFAASRWAIVRGQKPNVTQSIPGAL